MIEFLAFIFAGGFGFGLAFWIASTVLNHSNNYGDYHADASYYSASVHFTSDEKLKNSNSRGSYVGMGVFKKPTASQEYLSDQDEAHSTTPIPNVRIPAAAPASTPKGRDPSAFPRSFHDV